MRSWKAPKSKQKAGRRIFSLRALLLVFVLAVVVITEVQFDWAEALIGTYLGKTNTSRTQSGKLWEESRQTDKAINNLEQIVINRKSIQKVAQGADTLSQVISNIPNEEGVMISKDQFRRLYFKLPPILSQELMSPYALLKLITDGRWDRTYFDKTGEDLNIYILDNGNKVLHQLSIVSDLVEHLKRGEVSIDGRLDNLGDFATHIYSADRFFAMLESMMPQVKDGILSDPQTLLRISGKITRVGISEVVNGHTVEIGFEIDTGSGYKVLIVEGKEWDVFQLRKRLNN